MSEHQQKQSKSSSGKQIAVHNHTAPTPPPNVPKTTSCEELFYWWNKTKDGLVPGNDSLSFSHLCARLDERVCRSVPRDECLNVLTTCGNTVCYLLAIFTGQYYDDLDHELEKAYEDMADQYLKPTDHPEWLAQRLTDIVLQRNIDLSDPSSFAGELRKYGAIMSDIGIEALAALRTNLDVDSRRPLPRIFVPYLYWCTIDPIPKCEEHVFVIVHRGEDNFRMYQAWITTPNEPGYSLNDWLESVAESKHKSGISKNEMEKIMNGLYKFLDAGNWGDFDGDQFSELFTSKVPHFDGKSYYATFCFFEVSPAESPTPLLKSLAKELRGDDKKT